MSQNDDEKEESLLDIWNSVPRNARALVYTHLEKLLTEQRVAAAKETLYRDGHARPSGLIEDASPLHRAIMRSLDGIATAREILQALDEDICPECGEYHTEDEPHLNPKDLS